MGNRHSKSNSVSREPARPEYYATASIVKPRGTRAGIRLKFTPTGLVVLKITRDSTSKAYGELRVNDRIVTINGLDVQGMSQKKVGKLLKDIVRRPQLITEHNLRANVKQGEVGDCWLLAAIASITLHPKVFYRVVPPDQDFADNYAGIFHFQIWQYGEWTDIVIDDRLPVVSHSYGTPKLLYANSHQHVFWCPLLEKAFAKLYGSYHALEGGWTGEALEDMTGGITERIMPVDTLTARSLRKRLLAAKRMGSIMCCCVLDSRHENERLPNGLFNYHAYALTDVRDVLGDRLNLVRVLNPWGKEGWTGKPIEECDEWAKIPASVKAQLEPANNGEWWMKLEEFRTAFSVLEICHLSAEEWLEMERLNVATADLSITPSMAPSIAGSVVPDVLESVWREKVHHGQWIFNVNAGGHFSSHQSAKSFHSNPQYRFTLNKVTSKARCTLVVALMQKHRRRGRNKGLESLEISFELYELTGGDMAKEEHLNGDFFSRHKPVHTAPKFETKRQVTGCYPMTPGNYMVVPCTKDPNHTGEFMLRLFTNGTFIEPAIAKAIEIKKIYPKIY